MDFLTQAAGAALGYGEAQGGEFGIPVDTFTLRAPKSAHRASWAVLCLWRQLKECSILVSGEVCLEPGLEIGMVELVAVDAG